MIKLKKKKNKKKKKEDDLIEKLFVCYGGQNLGIYTDLLLLY